MRNPRPHLHPPGMAAHAPPPVSRTHPQSQRMGTPGERYSCGGKKGLGGLEPAKGNKS